MIKEVRVISFIKRKYRWNLQRNGKGKEKEDTYLYLYRLERCLFSLILLSNNWSLLTSGARDKVVTESSGSDQDNVKNQQEVAAAEVDTNWSRMSGDEERKYSSLSSGRTVSQSLNYQGETVIRHLICPTVSKSIKLPSSSVSQVIRIMDLEVWSQRTGFKVSKPSSSSCLACSKEACVKNFLSWKSAATIFSSLTGCLHAEEIRF